MLCSTEPVTKRRFIGQLSLAGIKTVMKSSSEEKQTLPGTLLTMRHKMKRDGVSDFKEKNNTQDLHCPFQYSYQNVLKCNVNHDRIDNQIGHFANPLSL